MDKLEFNVVGNSCMKLSENHDNNHEEYHPQDDDNKNIDQMLLKSDSKIIKSKMLRAKVWNIEVENSFRFQLAGYRDESEYLDRYPNIDFWEGPDKFVKCLQSKKTGYFMYFRKSRYSMS